MIRYQSDWRRYPNAIVDMNTNNPTFLKIAAVYKAMGIKHWYFPLTLLQPQLAGINVYSKDLTLEQKAAIIYECDNNPWFYLREVALDPGGGNTLDEQRFRAHRGNIAAMWLLISSIDYIQIQVRQTGKSFGTDTNTNWLTYFCYKTTQLNIITKDETLRKTNIERLKRLRDAWPDWLNRNTKKDDNNQISLSCHDRNNKLYTHVSQSSEKGAINLGRGMTSPYIHIDEAPFINHIELTVSTAMGATNAAREIARRKNFPYCTVFTTTAGNRETRDGRYVFDIWSNAAPFSEMFFDCNSRDEVMSLVKMNGGENNRTVNLTLNHLQLGLDDQWLYDAITNARTKGDNVDRDYFNQWTSSSQGSLLPPNIANVVRGGLMDPIDIWISKENYMFRWYSDLDPDEQYVLSIDTSDAIGRDDIGTTLICASDGGITGAAAVNETNLYHYAQWLVEFMIKYPNVTLIIERRYNAQVIIDILLVLLPKRGIDPFTRMYNEIVQNQVQRIEYYNKLRDGQGLRRPELFTECKKMFGFVTDADSRKLLYSNILMTAAKEAGSRMRDSKLIGQILNLVIKNDRIDHAASGNDDMVISWLIGHWFLNYGLNLSHYGLDPKRVMITRDVSGKQLTNEETLHKERQNKLLDDIDRVTDELKQATEFSDIYRLENQLSQLRSKVDEDVVGEVMTLDALIQDAKQHRDRRHTKNNYSMSTNLHKFLMR